MPTLHQPPHIFELPAQEALFFFAGPIQGARDWQAESLQYFEDNHHVANPRRDYQPRDFDKSKQVAWEERYLRRAAQHGGVVFWFAAQDFTLPYKKGRAYAQTSRIELGRVAGWKDHVPNTNMAIGIDPYYRGGNEDYFRDTAAEFDLPVHNTLADTCREIIRLVS